MNFANKDEEIYALKETIIALCLELYGPDNKEYQTHLSKQELEILKNYMEVR